MITSISPVMKFQVVPKKKKPRQRVPKKSMRKTPHTLSDDS